MQSAIVSSSYSSINEPHVGQLFASRSGVEEALRRAVKRDAPAPDAPVAGELAAAPAPASDAAFGCEKTGGDICLVGDESCVESDTDDEVPDWTVTDGCSAKWTQSSSRDSPRVSVSDSTATGGW